jgi:hypothetical protein
MPAAIVPLSRNAALFIEIVIGPALRIACAIKLFLDYNFIPDDSVINKSKAVNSQGSNLLLPIYNRPPNTS